MQALGFKNMKWIIGLSIALVVLALGWNFFQAKTGSEGGHWPPEVKAQVAESQARRAAVQAQDPELFEALRSVIFEHDLIGINFETNTDEYDPEVGTIIPRLGTCNSVVDVQSVVHEEFVHWFGLETAGPKDKYREMSIDIWRVWRERQTQQ
jgi:hypothetical protein